MGKTTVTRVEFEHVLNPSEVDSKYINLTDTHRVKHGMEMGQDGTAVSVIDGKGRRFWMRRHGGNQLRGCSEWFQKNNIQPDTKILVSFDVKERTLRLMPVSDARPTASPLVGCVSFKHEGKNYEIRYTPDGARLKVRVFVDGQPASEFEV
jgi:hypothetical protein